MASDKMFPSSKKITMGATSSLVDLKAELFKRKAEATARIKSSSASTSSGQHQSAATSKWKLKADLLEKQGKLKEIKPERRIGPARPPPPLDKLDDTDELELNLRKSREALERKTQVYNQRFQQAFQQMKQVPGDESSSSDDDEDENTLIDFKQKVVEESKVHKSNEEPPVERCPSSNVPDVDSHNDDDWVEFIDSLGRTRKCLKQDLPHFKKLDEDSVKIRLDDTTCDKMSPEIGPDPQMINRDNFYQNWVKETNENKITEDEDAPIGPIHYRNIQQEEVRDHGVGFFAFSADDDERKKQREMLDALRDQTKKQREARQKIKQKRKQQLKERLAEIAAKKGISFNSPDDISSDDDLPFFNLDNNPFRSVYDGKTARDIEVDRIKHVMIREWDVGKKDDSGRTVEPNPLISSKFPDESSDEPLKSKKETLLSDKTYRRDREKERNKDFAPPTAYFFDDPKEFRQKGFSAHQTTRKMTQVYNQDPKPYEPMKSSSDAYSTGRSTGNHPVPSVPASSGSKVLYNEPKTEEDINKIISEKLQLFRQKTD